MTAKWLILNTILLYFSSVCALGSDTLKVSTVEELQAIFTEPVFNTVVLLESGEYHLTPTEFIDSSCGNCEDPNTLVTATYGLHISGGSIILAGPEDYSAVIVTHSGYGLFIKDCSDIVISRLTITGGVRDSDPNATDAAIVMKNGNYSIINNVIRDNIGDSVTVVSNVVGVMGVCGRENSISYISKNQIIRNSWDGIALYRDAKSIIINNVIDGVDKAGGKQAGGGRGVAIGVTWNGNAVIQENLIKRYWKGIGLFVDAHGDVQFNIIEDMLTWGVSVWDADRGTPIGRFTENIIYNTGACGASITRSVPGQNPGEFSRNMVVHTAQDPRYDSPDHYCYQCALAEHAVPDNFIIYKNIFYDNRRATDDLPDYDLSEADFGEAIEPVCQKFSSYEIFEESDFIREFCIKK